MKKMIAPSVGQVSSAIRSSRPAEENPIRAQIADSSILASTTPWHVAVQQVAAREAGLDRQLTTLRDIRAKESTLVVGDRKLELGEKGLQPLCRALQAPADYLGQLSPSLRNLLLNDHLRRAAASQVEQKTVILSRDGIFRGLDRGDLHRLAATDVLDSVRHGLDGVQSDPEVQALNFVDEALQIDIMGPQLTDEVRVGDLIRYGLRVRHSSIGEFATTIESFAFRLMCSNGLVQRQCLGRQGTARSRPRTRRLPGTQDQADKQQREQIKRLAAAAWERLRGMGAGIRQLQQRHFDLANLQRFLKQARMYSENLFKSVEAAWSTEGAEPTAYALLNALTRVATHETSLSVQLRRRLDLLAGIFAGQDVHLCDRCFSLIRG